MGSEEVIAASKFMESGRPFLDREDFSVCSPPPYVMPKKVRVHIGRTPQPDPSGFYDTAIYTGNGGPSIYDKCYEGRAITVHIPKQWPRSPHEHAKQAAVDAIAQLLKFIDQLSVPEYT